MYISSLNSIIPYIKIIVALMAAIVLFMQAIVPLTNSIVAFNRLSLENLEKLCMLFSCTPHDLLEWQPENEIAGKEPLSVLQKQINLIDFRYALRTLPYAQLAELQKAIEKIQKDER